MTKKKFLAVALVAILAITAAVGSSLAYLRDSKKVENTFTWGKVRISLIEQQRGENGLEPFVQNKKLLPIVGSAQGEKDEYGMPVARNYVDKMITIQNTGDDDAYIRAYFAIPSALDDGYETFNAGMNVLHFNFGNKVTDGVISTTEGVEWKWTHDGKWNYFETEIDGVKYNVYYADYYKAIGADETTVQFVQGVYLDKSFEMRENEDGKYSGYAFDKPIQGWDWENETVSCPVFAVAVQADGFDSPAEAFNAALGANYNPWGGDAYNWQ